MREYTYIRGDMKKEDNKLYIRKLNNQGDIVYEEYVGNMEKFKGMDIDREMFLKGYYIDRQGDIHF